MKILNYFPEGIARGDTFLNRDIEREYLSNRIKANKHSVLIAPRRYGKTSLVMKVADEMGSPYTAIDFLAAYSEEYIRDHIVDKITHLLFSLLPRAAQAKEKLLAIFRQMKPEISIGAFGQRLSLHFSDNPLKDITELLLKLDETAACFQKQAVIFMDEFQQISQLKNHHSIEASIRHAVERSQHIAYVFSGSHRGLLKQMFGESGRPLYRLCQIITLDRMEKNVYISRLQNLAQRQWKQKIAVEVLEQIFTCTGLHPYYMNVLCQFLWEEDKVPSAESINRVWHQYVERQRHIIGYDILSLSPNQRRIMIALAKTPTREIQSTEFTLPVKISPSSAKQAVDVLMQIDLVYQDEAGWYRVLDPAIRYYLDVLL